MPERPPLTSLNLQSLDISAGKAQRDARITSFLQSQRRYVSHFASEDHHRLADGCATPKHEKSLSPSRKYLIGFATPTLKPRNTLKKDGSTAGRDQNRKVESKKSPGPDHNTLHGSQKSLHPFKYHHRRKHDSYPIQTNVTPENRISKKTAPRKKRKSDECTSEIERNARKYGLNGLNI
jgi:hypothetical protein